MPILFIKSLLSLIVIVSALFAMVTMFEVLGRERKGEGISVEGLKRMHRFNGIFFLLLSIAIAYLCVEFIRRTKTELTPRAAFHSVFAIAALSILIIKILIVKVYRKMYGMVKAFGITILLLTIGMVSTSGGYYLLIGKGHVERQNTAVLPQTGKFAVRSDMESINRGKDMYDSKCSFCHDPMSHEVIVGPGHKGILKNPSLPASGRPAIPENVIRQILTPYEKMPSFSYLTGDEILDILAYLNTL